MKYICTTYIYIYVCIYLRIYLFIYLCIIVSFDIWRPNQLWFTNSMPHLGSRTGTKKYLELAHVWICVSVWLFEHRVSQNFEGWNVWIIPHHCLRSPKIGGLRVFWDTAIWEEGIPVRRKPWTGSGQSQAGILGFLELDWPLELEGLEFWPLELAIGIRDCKGCYPLYLSFLLVYGLMKPKRSMGQFELRTASQTILMGRATSIGHHRSIFSWESLNPHLSPYTTASIPNKPRHLSCGGRWLPKLDNKLQAGPHHVASP